MSKDEITRTVDELAGKVEKDNVTVTDIDTAQRLARKWLYDGHEPYAPALYSIAAMLAEHRREVQADLIAQRDAYKHALELACQKIHEEGKTP